MDASRSAAQGLSFRAAALKVLADAREPLRPRVIVERALAAGLLTTGGKTPDQTMAAQLYTEVRDQGERSEFVRAGKNLFGLREWGLAKWTDAEPMAGSAAPSSRKIVPLSSDPADRLAAEILTAQHESYNSAHFEQVLTEAFSFLGFRAAHVGGSGRTDILLEAPVSVGPYRVVVDAKSNKGGRIADANVDWNSLADHRRDEGADHALVVAPGFGAGNLLRRADDYGVALLPAGLLAELVRLHRSAPFSLIDLRVLFASPGLTTAAVEQLRQVAHATLSRSRLIGEIVRLIDHLPSTAYVDAQKLWLLLYREHQEQAPSLESVEDAVAILASRAIGVLKQNNGGGEYSVTMRSESTRSITQGSAGEVRRAPRSRRG